MLKKVPTNHFLKKTNQLFEIKSFIRNPYRATALSALSLIGGPTLSPAFNEATTSYSVDLDQGTTELNISATATDDMATIAGDGILPLVLISWSKPLF